MDEEGRQGSDRATIRLADVAREAGVGIATASRALSNISRVNRRTRTRVLDAAERLGYVGNVAARSLRSGLSRIVLVITPPWQGFNVLEPTLHGIDAELRRAGHSMIVSTLERDGSADPRMMEIARGGLVDGVLAVTNQPLESGELAILSARLPSVGLLVDLGSFGVKSVVVSEREGVRQLTAHLIAAGRRRLLFVGGLPGYHTIERRAGFEEAIRASRLPVGSVHLEGDYTPEAGRRVAASFLLMADRPDGAVFTNDRMAVAFMAALRLAGVRVPKDISVTGFDDIELATYCKPPLTTYRQPMEEMGAQAARLLLAAIRGELAPDVEPIVLTGNVIFRESA